MSATTPPVRQSPAEPVLVDALGLPLDPLPHILPAGGISLLAGAPNVGKTALLATMARALREGRPVFGRTPGTISNIGIICADRSWLKGAGVWFERAGYGHIHHYAMTDDRSFDPRSLRRKFERVARLFEMIARLQLPPHSLVLVDPIGLFLGGNLLDYDSCACACHEIRALLRDRELTLWGMAHSSKLKADKNARYLRLADQLLGSTAIAGFADTQMYLASPEEIGKPYYAFVWHPHTAAPETFFLERDEQGLFVTYSGADEGNCTRVLALFPDADIEITTAALRELVEAIPLSRATFFRVLDTLVEREKIRKVRHGVYARVAVH